MDSLNRHVWLGVLLGGVVLVAPACDDPVEPEPPVVMDATYQAIHSRVGPLPIRFDQQYGTRWASWLTAATLEFRPDQSFRLEETVRDSFPEGNEIYSEWWVVGTYEIEQDTIVHFHIDNDESMSKFGPAHGRIWPASDRLIIDMFGLIFHNPDG